MKTSHLSKFGQIYELSSFARPGSQRWEASMGPDRRSGRRPGRTWALWSELTQSGFDALGSWLAASSGFLSLFSLLCTCCPCTVYPHWEPGRSHTVHSACSSRAAWCSLGASRRLLDYQFAWRIHWRARSGCTPTWSGLRFGRQTSSKTG